MPDQRIIKLAKILVHYSIELKPGDLFAVRSNPLAHELTLMVYQEAVKAGAHVLNNVSLPGGEEIFYKYANDDQLAFVSPVRRLITESFDAILSIGAEYNTRALTAIDPLRLSRARKASTPLTKIFLKRSAKKNFVGATLSSQQMPVLKMRT
jgi:aminopeptidase